MATSIHSYGAFNRVPESELIRIGYRPNDFLERCHVREPGQKVMATIVPLCFTRACFTRYVCRYGPYPWLRVTSQLRKWPARRILHWAMPLICAAVTVSFMEMTYNRAILGLQGAEALPDQVLKRKVIYH